MRNDPRREKPDFEQRRVQDTVAARLFGTAPAPTRIGRFLVIERVGQGATGDVYAAYDAQLDRRVALKLLRAVGSEEPILSEARTMASINHPNVAQIYEVGSIGEQIFIAMEFVAGPTLRSWQTAAPRRWSQVVAMYRQAAGGLAAAHAAGIVHRDFKPDNALVGEDERVRVVDFGLARSDAPVEPTLEPERGVVHDADAGEAATRTGSIAGTPAYMAPEQLRGRTIDARSDQFAFCVALYEGLHRQRPFAGTTPAALLENIEREKIERAAHDAEVPAWIMAIIRRGLSPDPADRYPSMTDLVAAIDRDPSRRRRLALAFGTMGLIAVGAFGWHRADLAATHTACEAEGAAMAATWSDDRATQLRAAFTANASSYAADAWDRVEPRLNAWAGAWAHTRTELCRAHRIDRTITPTLAEDAAACLDERFAQFSALLETFAQPDASTVRRAMSSVVSLPPAVQCRDEREVARLMRSPPNESARQAVHAVRRQLARAEAARTAADYDNALRTAEAALDDAQTLGWSPLSAEAHVAVGMIARDTGRLSEARATLERGFFLAVGSGHDHVAVGAANALVDTIGMRQSKHTEALHWIELARMHLQRMQLAEESADLATLLQNAGAVHVARGAYDDARRDLGRALAISEDVLGPEHPLRAKILVNLGNLAHTQGAYDDALALFGQALEHEQGILGPAHPDVALVLNNLGATHRSRGNYAAALHAHEQALQIRTNALGHEHPDVAASLINIGNVQLDRAANDEALIAFQRALAIQEATLGPEHPQLAKAIGGLARVHQARGAFDQALEYAERSLAITEQALGPHHAEVGQAATAVAIVHRALGDQSSALTVQTRALAIWEEALGPEHPLVATALNNLGAMHRSLGDAAAALAAHERALAIREHVLGPDHVEVAASLTNIANLHADRGADDLALAGYRRAMQIYEATVGADHPAAAHAREGIEAVTQHAARAKSGSR